jgi:hypothetical protein
MGTGLVGLLLSALWPEASMAEESKYQKAGASTRRCSSSITMRP